jgi:hypothetical protein
MKNNIEYFLKKEQLNLKEFKIKSSNDYIKYLNLKNCHANLFGSKNQELLELCCHKISEIKDNFTTIDYYDFMLKTAISDSKIKKTAYPNRGNSFFTNPIKRYDLTSWSECVKRIYKTHYADKIPYEDAVESESSNFFKDKEEKENFLKWLKYFNKGEHLKYNVKIPGVIEKSASFNSSLSPVGDPYYSSAYPIGFSEDSSELKDHDALRNEVKDQADKKTNYRGWKKRFNTAIRRVDKLLKESEDYIDGDKYEEIMETLHRLDVQVGKVRLQSTASDLSYKTSQSLLKLGFHDGANILRKFAQEATPPVPTPEPVAPETSEASPEEAASQQVLEQNRAKERQNDRNNLDKGEEIIKNLAPSPGAAPGEYDNIIPDSISMDDAAKKLEVIAGTLSDRRVIRYLAEFDIMLDKLGIASLFPELAEAQSKLIESYSYALTRVTKMLGMLSNNKAIMELATNNPKIVGKDLENSGPESQQQVSQETSSEPVMDKPNEGITG